MANFYKALQAKKSIETKLTEQSQIIDEKNNKSSTTSKSSTTMNLKEGKGVIGNEKESDKRYQECTKLVQKATEKFQQIPLLTNNEIRQMYDKEFSISKEVNVTNDSTDSNRSLRKEINNIILVDCRSQQEIEVSMMRNAISEDQFNDQYLSKLTKLLEKEKQKLTSSTDSSTGSTSTVIDRNSTVAEFTDKVIISYCTVGYRSGLFAKKLLDLKEELNSIGNKKFLSSNALSESSDVTTSATMEKNVAKNFNFQVYNSEGIVKATWDGAEFVTRNKDTKEYTILTKTIHTYGKTWDFARTDYKTVQFKSKVWNFLVEPVVSFFAR